MVAGSVGESKGDFSINSDATISIEFIGREKCPIIIIDNVMNDPEPLACFAPKDPSFWVEADNSYPGIRAQVPDSYYSNIYAAIKSLMYKTFDIRTNTTKSAYSCFSLTTSSPEDLKNYQRIPHFDTLAGNQYALVHYLCDAPHGGTSFYRHKKTGFESITESRWDEYWSKITAEWGTYGQPDREYIVGDTESFVRTKNVEIKYDRVLIYPGGQLHSGNIDPLISLSPDPQVGRLTITTFIEY
jgi:hypothetical protein